MHIFKMWFAIVILIMVSSTVHGGVSLNTPIPDPTYVYGTTLLAMSPDGQLYSCNGDTISRWIPAENRFEDVVTGIESAVGGSVEPSGFAMLTSNVGVVLSGWSDVIALANLNTGVVTTLGSVSLSGNFGAATDPVWGRVFITDSAGKVYMLDTVAGGSAALFYEPSAALFGSGLAFDESGNLFLPVATGFSAWPTDDLFPIDLVKIPANYVTDFVTGGVPDPNDIEVLVSGAMVSGSASVAVDEWGAVYIEGLHGIYRIDTASGEVTVFEGEPSEHNVFSSPYTGPAYGGMAYDSANNRLLYGLGTGYPPSGLLLTESVIPEPTTIAFLGFGLLGVLATKRRSKTRK
ncbi:MAG: PEP-CTERM sorting domain-containing protein [Planctomycetia bacterium]|nr:PEP-CTERM sorting domain-containing protein [Planctomycetia bacterium]